MYKKQIEEKCANMSTEKEKKDCNWAEEKKCRDNLYPKYYPNE